MSGKIFRSIMAAAAVVLLASLLIITGFLYHYFNEMQTVRLKEELLLAKVGVECCGETYFDGARSDSFRFTLISADGTVQYDSEASSPEMENHLDREEIRQALENGSGSSARYSATLTERTFYEAVRLSDGDILRISATQVTFGALLVGLLPAILAIVLASALIAFALSQKMARSIVKPLETLDLEHPAENDVYEELTPVLARLNYQHRQITRQMRELRRKSDEFRQITASMHEGLVLLDQNGIVLSINEAALRLFQAKESDVGEDFLHLDRSDSMRRAVRTALAGKRTEFVEARCGGEYRFMLTPTQSDGKSIGVVLLCIDVTQSAFAERNRKEFTANVSHELKTPLQSIIGSAELLENGLVKAEDTAKFIGNIKTEASRLVTLINDIIRLSELDENAELPKESVALFELASEIVDELRPAASDRKVTLCLHGAPCAVRGIRRYLYEIIYNLCDNAIRYNREGGRVDVEVRERDGHAVLQVRDNGIGIPQEHLGRIFERFYRVDKSHSKETGGTGLGLSIVKHAVACHGGTVRLDSTVGQGTTVTVIL